MNGEKVVRTELVQWEQEKMTVELYEEHMCIIPLGEKTIDIRYAHISSCKRFHKELYITSKTTTDTGYDIQYIPMKFVDRDVAESYYQYIVERLQKYAQIQDSEEEFGDSDKPSFMIPTMSGFVEGVLYIFDDHFSFHTSEESRNIRVHYLNVQEVIKYCGSIRFVMNRKKYLSFAIPKQMFQDVFHYLEVHIAQTHVHEITGQTGDLEHASEDAGDEETHAGADTSAIADSNEASGSGQKQ